MTLRSWTPLKKGDVIDVIAPGYGTSPQLIEKVKLYLQNKGYIPRISDTILGSDPLCANHYEERLTQLKDALMNSESKAVWCLKGGYGTTQLMEDIFDINKPDTQKIFIGFSDNTALHTFLTQQWGWHTLHAPVLWQIVKNMIDHASEQQLWNTITGKVQQQEFTLTPLNNVNVNTTHSSVIGGNLMLVQSSLCTSWQVDTREKILFLEEIDETPYRVDRMLVHLSHTPLLRESKALIFGDFTGEKIEKQRELTDYSLQKCATYCKEQFNLPVLKLSGVGHDKTHYPLPFNTPAHITQSNNHIKLTVQNHGR